MDRNILFIHSGCTVSVKNPQIAVLSQGQQSAAKMRPTKSLVERPWLIYWARRFSSSILEPDLGATRLLSEKIKQPPSCDSILEERDDVALHGATLPEQELSMWASRGEGRDMLMRIVATFHPVQLVICIFVEMLLFIEHKIL